MRVFLAILLISGNTFAQSDRVFQDLDPLCGPYMAGRGYVDSGHLKAAKYIAERFEKIGLHSFDSTYYQKFEIDVNTFPEDQYLKINRRELLVGEAFIPKSFSSSGKGRARLYFLDTTIFSNAEARVEFLNKNLKRKAVVYTSEDYSRISELPMDYVEHLFSSEISIELKKRLISSYSSAQYKSLNIEVLDSLISSDSKRIKYNIESEFKEDLQTQNVIGYLPASIDNAPYVIISAHYDHMGKIGDAYFPGANDNASGVTMMLDLANYYARNRKARKYNYVFIAFGAEETGLSGSEYFVKHSYFDLKDIRFVMNLDLMGNGEEGITIVNGKVFKKEAEIIQKINNYNHLVPEIKLRGKAANSDHYHFSERGVPAFFIYTMGGKAWYHDIYDKPSELGLKKYAAIRGLIIQFFNQLDSY